MVNGSSDGKMAHASFLKEYTWVMAQTALQESLFVDGWGGPSSHMFAMAVQAVRGNLTPLVQAVG